MHSQYILTSLIELSVEVFDCTSLSDTWIGSVSIADELAAIFTTTFRVQMCVLCYNVCQYGYKRRENVSGGEMRQTWGSYRTMLMLIIYFIQTQKSSLRDFFLFFLSAPSSFSIRLAYLF
jgi:hypothetical protein